MVDKVKPLKIENPSLGGTETDPYPTEADPSEDYVSTKGIAFEGLDTFLYEKTGRVLIRNTPDDSQKPTFDANCNLTNVEFFTSASQITANRIARVDVSYTGENPTSEEWKIYDTDGTTVLRTLTLTHTFVANDLSNTVQATT